MNYTTQKTHHRLPPICRKQQNVNTELIHGSDTLDCGERERAGANNNKRALLN